jgi:hypothetical protein
MAAVLRLINHDEAGCILLALVNNIFKPASINGHYWVLDLVVFHKIALQIILTISEHIYFLMLDERLQRNQCFMSTYSAWFSSL